jgi:E3 ubiquitin-protein ligase HUWE1
LQNQEDVITHPLLSNTPSTPSNTFFPRNDLDDAFGRVENPSNWRAFENIIGGSAARMLEDLFSHAPTGAQSGSFRVDVQDGPRGTMHSYEIDNFPHFNRAQPSQPVSGNSGDQIQEVLALLHDFQPMTSGERWHQEARMMYGTNISEKALRLVNDLLNALVPIAIEDDRKARLEEEAKRKEQRRKEEEEHRKAEEERWRLEKEKKAAEAEAAAAAAAAAAAETESATNEEASSSADQDTTMTEAAAESTQEDRTTVVIHGEPVDISGTGIDVEFLEALPDDLREEVVNQHMRNRPTPAQPMEDDSISPEFLDALPPDIREEVLHQEAIERNRRDRQQRQAAAVTETQGK